MSLCVYVNTSAHNTTHTRMHTHTHTRTHTHIRKHIHTCQYSYMNTHTYTQTHTQTHTHTYAKTHTFSHAHKHTRTCRSRRVDCFVLVLSKTLCCIHTKHTHESFHLQLANVMMIKKERKDVPIYLCISVLVGVSQWWTSFSFHSCSFCCERECSQREKDIR